MRHLFILILTFLFLSSCTVDQNFYFNKDGSGKMDLEVDVSSLIQLSQMYASKPDTSSKEKFEDWLVENLDKIDLDMKIDLIDIMPDSIKEKFDDPELLRGLGFAIHNHGEESKLAIHYEFKSIEDLDSKLEKLTKISKNMYDSKSVKDNELTGFLPKSNGINDFKFSDQIKFKKGKIVISPKSSNQINKEGEQNTEDQMMSSMMKIRTIIHLPGKVKKKKNQNYKIINKNEILIPDSKIGVINTYEKKITIKYKRGWWDIF